ncbi:MAG: membrane-bound lytic murein transglycosylase MltF [Lysobacterales bacterium]
MYFSATGQGKRKAAAALAVFILLPFLYSGSDHPTRLQQAQQRGSLTFLTRNGASSYFIGPDGAAGPEYDIASAFARYLGLKINVKIADEFGSLETLLDKRQGEFIAANLTRTPAREQRFNFGPDYAEVDTMVVYKRGKYRPRQLADLVGLRLSVIAGSSYESLLEKARETLPDLQWTAERSMGMEDLLLAVADGELDATLVDSNIFKINSQFYPRLKPGFMLADHQHQAWAFLQGDDDSLVQKARSFFKVVQENGRLAAIQSRYDVNSNNLDRVGMFQFMKQVRNRLPALVPLFQEVAQAHELDWRLLAAMGYQESHWDADAASQTGVRGIMMLTRKTATQLGITDRLDPEQSIEGGARYFLRMRKRIPSRIPEPDRTWMALAAYNMGWGHLEDTRKLTQKQGGNPDRWQDVNERLPLLSQEKWYRQTRFGYARGFEARQYVENIRSYFDTLVWMETHAHPMLVTQL